MSPHLRTPPSPPPPRTRRALLVLASGLGLFWLTGCGDSVVELSFPPEKRHVLKAAGATLQLEPDVRLRSGAKPPPESLKWHSLDPRIATVQAGKVTAVRSGSVTIEVSAGGLKTSTRVDVYIPVRLEIRPSQLELRGEGKKGELVASLRDQNGRRVPDTVILWEVAHPHIARVEEGTVTALSSGVTEVRASTGEFRAKSIVRVIPSALSLLVARPTQMQLTLGARPSRIEVRPLDSEGRQLPPVPLEWFSSDTAVVEVDEDGYVTPRGAGSTLVTAIAGSRRVGITVTVKPPDVGARPTR